MEYLFSKWLAESPAVMNFYSAYNTKALGFVLYHGIVPAELELNYNSKSNVLVLQNTWVWNWIIIPIPPNSTTRIPYHKYIIWIPNSYKIRHLHTLQYTAHAAQSYTHFILIPSNSILYIIFTEPRIWNCIIIQFRVPIKLLDSIVLSMSSDI